jgi:hypothetical protein
MLWTKSSGAPFSERYLQFEHRSIKLLPSVSFFENKNENPREMGIDWWANHPCFWTENSKIPWPMPWYRIEQQLSRLEDTATGN